MSSNSKASISTTAPRSSSPSIWNRKFDLVYLSFFTIHIIAMLLVDLVPLYPPALKPQFLTTLRTWYITTYQDQFFTAPPAWFDAFVWMEACYHLPLSIWAVGALMRNDPMVPVHLLVYSVQTAMTTLTCIVDFMSWNVKSKVKLDLGGLYAPYLILSVVMGLDMFGRLHAKLSSSGKA